MPESSTTIDWNTTVPVYDPTGTLRAIPQNQSKKALAVPGAKRAVPMMAPDGKHRWIREDQIQDAIRSGGRIDYPADKQIPKWFGFTLDNVVHNAWEGAKGLVSGVGAMGEDLAKNPNWIFGPNSTYEKFVGKPAEEQAKIAEKKFKRRQYAEAAGHEAAGAIPLVGPWAASLGEQAGTGDIGGAAGQAAGTVAGGELLAKTPKILGRTLEGVKEGIKETRKAPGVKAAQEIKQVTTNVKPNFAERLDRTITRGYLPEIERRMKPRDVREAANAILDYADTIQKEIVKPAIERHASDIVSGDSVAKAVQDSLTPEVEKYFPESLGPISKEAGRYAGQGIRLDEANLIVEKLNAINRTLEKASPEDAGAAQKVNVAKAASKAAADKLRELLYDRLDTLGEKGIREYQKDYGALRTVGEALRDKAPRAERIGKGSGLVDSAFRKHPWITLVSLVGGYGLHTPAMAAIPFMSWVMEKRGTPNALITRAMKRLGKTDFTPTKPPVEPPETMGAADEAPALTTDKAGEAAAPGTPVVPKSSSELMQSASRQFMDDKVSAVEYRELLRKAMPDATEETLNRVVKGIENLKRSRKSANPPKPPASS